MRWPWVSRSALDAVTSERDHLRHQVDALTDSVVRLQRSDRGLPEVPRQPKRNIEPMPDALAKKIKQWANPSLQKMHRDEAIRRHVRDGIPWPQVEADYDREQEDPLETIAASHERSAPAAD